LNPQLAVYKAFIDGLVKHRHGVLGQWITSKGWPDLPENRKINELLARLSTKDKEVLANIARQARDGGIHDTLVFLNEQINLNGLRISAKGVEMAVEPYGTELFWDWTCRCAGDSWPEHQLEDKYK